MIKQRKLYQVRYFEGSRYSQAVGSGRLVPRSAASRVVKRLKRAGVQAISCPMLVNLNEQQAAYLQRRYG